MGHRTRDIINLREAARRCRSNVETAQGARAETFLRLAEEIDGLILSLIGESDRGAPIAASPSCRMLPAEASARGRPELAALG